MHLGIITYETPHLKTEQCLANFVASQKFKKISLYALPFVERKKRKVLTDEFLGKGLMFDLFNKEHTEWVYEPQEGTRDILLIQLETGLMAKYELTEEGVDLSQLIFELQPKWMEDLLGMNWVEGVRCNNGDSIKTKEDTLIRENRVKWINYEEE